MANKKISELSVAQELTGNELVVVVQDGITKRTPVSNLLTDGQSAYDLAVTAGFVGTTNEYLLSLKGDDGLDGKTAYQSALDVGFVGTEEQWIESLTPSQAGVVVVSHSFIASEALTEGDIVNIWNSVGVPKARKADSATEGNHAHGFIIDTVAINASVTVYFSGVNNKCLGLVIGDQYLSTTPGITSPFTPNMSGQVLQTVGLAISSTTMFFNPSDAAILA